MCQTEAGQQEKTGVYPVLTLFKSSKKRELECVWCSMVKNFKSPLKIKRWVLIKLISRVTCLNTL